MTTVGIPNYFRSYKLSDGSAVNVHIMDTSGQEQFRAINEIYYKNADCCLLVYDITNRKSFEEMKYYNEQMKKRCKENVKAILLGNKTDLENERQVPSEEGAYYSMINDYIFMETSCLQNKNVADAFTTLIEITNIEFKKNSGGNNNLQLKKTYTTKENKKKRGICKS
jgi:Ras-related protein Rab-11A